MEFFETVMGKRFYEHTMPSIAKSLATIAKAVEQKPQEPGTCYIIRCDNYADGKDAVVYRTEPAARTAMNADIEATIHELEEQGYKPVKAIHSEYAVDVYVPDSDIYYEWELISSTIK